MLLRKTATLILFLVISFGIQQVYAQVRPGRTNSDSVRNSFGIWEKVRLGIRDSVKQYSPLPGLFKREVEYDPINKQYIIRNRIGDRLLGNPQYLSIDEYQRLMDAEIKAQHWRSFSDTEVTDYRRTGILPPLTVNSRTFERLFGGNTIDI